MESLPEFSKQSSDNGNEEHIDENGGQEGRQTFTVYESNLLVRVRVDKENHRIWGEFG
jgi:hypothetical protein